VNGPVNEAGGLEYSCGLPHSTQVTPPVPARPGQSPTPIDHEQDMLYNSKGTPARVGAGLDCPV